VKSPKIAAHFLVKDEDDVIEECINHAAQFCDYILVLDNGSTDRTYEICKKHPRVNYCEQILCTYSDALRNHLLEASKGYLNSRSDWFLALSADHFFDTNPREDIRQAIAEKSNIITYDVAQFYFTDKDYIEATDNKNNWLSKSVEERIKYYTINYFDFPVAFRFKSQMTYTEQVTEWPAIKTKHIASFKPILKHYQFRSIQQMKKRLEVRKQEIQKGFKGFRHYRSFNWNDYIFSSNYFYHFNETCWERLKKPTLDELLGYTSLPLSIRLKQTIKKLLRW
jgi:glycosyltransferase involved in cell wall biosynthesis